MGFHRTSLHSIQKVVQLYNDLLSWQHLVSKCTTGESVRQTIGNKNAEFRLVAAGEAKTRRLKPGKARERDGSSSTVSATAFLSAAFTTCTFRQNLRDNDRQQLY